MMRPRWNELLAIFLAAAATLLFEITATKIFEFSLWANYAYLVISTAMFGLGLSGVLLTRFPRLLRYPEAGFLSLNSVLCGGAVFGAFLVMNFVPIHLPEAPRGWPSELGRVSVVFFALATPFLFFGFVISYLFEHRGRQANVYYFADLVGAGVGSFALVPLIPLFEPQGLVVVSAMAAVVAGALFLLSSPHRAAARGLALVLLAVAAAGLWWWTPRVARQLPLRVHVPKRGFVKDMRAGRIEATGWSALSRVDIAPLGRDKNRKRVWIAGGVNESSIVRFDGDYERLRGQREKTLARAAEVLDHKALPHLSKTNHTVCMIGTSGGEDSLYALMLGARRVVGVEMDPTIAHLVTNTYREFAGGLFTDGDYSEMVVDEGRSYLRNTDQKFDVIQQVNNFTPIAFQNGALNLSESYLLTAESFKDFYDRLTDDGILAISRYGSIRMLSTGIEMFRRMGLRPEEYSKHMVVCEGANWVINSFLMKKSPFTPEEIDRLFEFFSQGEHNRRIVYAPYRTNDLPALAENLYYRMVTADDPSPYHRMGCFTFAPTTDNRPFFNRMKILGLKDGARPAGLPGEIRHIEPPNVLDRRVPPGDLPPLIVLLEALVLASVFFGLPMLSRRELREALRVHRRELGYFACLGMAFIIVEICLIHKLVLFLGAPVYSIATVFCSLLVFAGLGSLCSGALGTSRATLRRLLPLVALVVLALYFSMGHVTSRFLGRPLPVRVLVALGFTGIAGFFMGMPMPTGIRYLADRGRFVIPWAWAVNGYFTVIGSTLSVLLAVHFGFTAAFVLAGLIYAAAPLFLAGDHKGVGED